MALGLAVLALYGRVLGHEFVNLDDGPYIVDNPQVRAGLSWSGLRWAFTTGHASNWHPLTWLSHMTDVQIAGVDPAWPHLVNVLFHVANTVLLLYFVHRLTRCLAISVIVAVLFSLHPLRVESVAWAAERKDVLSACFWLLASHAYLTYAARRRLRDYGAVTLFLALGLLAKPVLVTLPFVFLLLDFGQFEHEASRSGGAPRLARSTRRLVLEKVPWIAMAAGSAIVTMAVQRTAGSFSAIETIPAQARLANAVIAYATYLKLTFWPVGLAAFYPHPATVTTDPMAVLRAPALASGVVLTAITLGALLWARRDRWPVVGWFWYLGTLVPMAGLVQVGSQSMADRYTYLPLIGVYLALGTIARTVVRHWPRVRPAIGGAGVAAALGLCLLTWKQVGVWRTSESLFEHALSATERNYVAHNNLGMEYTASGRLEDAADQFEAALQIQPQLATALYNLGFLHVRQGDLQAAARRFEQTLQVQPDHGEAQNNLGRILEIRGDHAGAIAYYRAALRSPSSPAVAARNLAWILATSPDLALRDGTEALRWARIYAANDPQSMESWTTLAAASAEAGRFAEAVEFQERAAAQAPETRRAEILVHLDEYRAGRRYAQPGVPEPGTP